MKVYINNNKNVCGTKPTQGLPPVPPPSGDAWGRLHRRHACAPENPENGGGCGDCCAPAPGATLSSIHPPMRGPGFGLPLWEIPGARIDSRPGDDDDMLGRKEELAVLRISPRWLRSYEPCREGDMVCFPAFSAFPEDDATRCKGLWGLFEDSLTGRHPWLILRLTTAGETPAAPAAMGRLNGSYGARLVGVGDWSPVPTHAAPAPLLAASTSGELC